ncbi:hypothetical protein OVA21_06950 [Dietzia sp. SL131]|uniref:hypothetical protein n=1 Tax=Dietzia sp. SL131 TaxID=2995149 RepID=UPI00227D4D49|nr:hypothetical protein [Dietzia sp. SL131]MCY1656944.1 hypothetical protein [Dietzia sp. SL131]
MTTHSDAQLRLIWATRGRNWGFRFLLGAGLEDPLLEYERAFGGDSDASEVFHRSADSVAVRFLDPLQRRDSAGRVIPHEIVAFGADADLVDSLDAGIRELWPRVSGIYAQIWDSDDPPSRREIERGRF